MKFAVIVRYEFDLSWLRLRACTTSPSASRTATGSMRMTLLEMVVGHR